jgi:hypothetical protein
MMLGAQTDPIESSRSEPAKDADRKFEFARGELRLALIQAIARRVGKSLEPVSIQEACFEIPLAELYQRKLYNRRFSEIVERLLFRWWR